MTGDLSVRTVSPATPSPSGRATPWAVAERGGTTVGYARIRTGGDLELALDDELSDPAGVGAALVRPLTERTGSGPTRWWVNDARPGDREVARALGLAPSRELWQMRVPLPLPDRTALDWRPFVPGQDESAWLEVNNRAFAGHRDQGGQTLERLLAKEAEPWFDPAGFVLHERDGRLQGFCWTKVHRDVDPPLGEIFVIGVDPAAHGRGLGRDLVVAGLDHLHGAGLTVGMLYVDADNVAAVGLYRSLGFVTVRRDVEFTLGPGQPVETPTSEPTR